MCESQGSKANSQGSNFENIYGIDIIKQAESMGMVEDKSVYACGSNQLFSYKTQVCYKGIFGGEHYPSKSDVVFVYNKYRSDQKVISIEMRSQEVSGSVDEKIPVLIGNASLLDSPYVIILLKTCKNNRGNQVEAFAKHYLKHFDPKIYASFIGVAVKRKIMYLFNPEEMQAWINGGFVFDNNCTHREIGVVS